MGFRDEERASRDRIASLEARAAEVDRLREENAALRRRVAELELQASPAPTPGAAADPERTPDSLPPLSLPQLDELRAAGRWSEAVEWLSGHAEAIIDADHQLLAYLHAGRIAEESLADPWRARELYERALALDPRQGHALDALLRIAESSEDWARTRSLREARLELASDDATRIAEHLALAKLAEHLLGEVDAALHHARQIEALDPGHAEAAAILARLR